MQNPTIVPFVRRLDRLRGGVAPVARRKKTNGIVKAMAKTSKRRAASPSSATPRSSVADESCACEAKAPSKCAICYEPMEAAETCAMPLCGHRLHVACVIQAAQYDVRCPICRCHDPAIVPRAHEPAPPTLFERVEMLVADHNAQHRRYMQRRARVIRADTRLRRLNERLKHERRAFEALDKRLERTWMSRQKRLWRDDPQLNHVKQLRRRQQQRATRLRTQLDRTVEERIGSHPTLSMRDVEEA